MRFPGLVPIEDARDSAFPITHILRGKAPTIMSRFHKPGRILDQGPDPHCVGYACHQLLQSEPVPQKSKGGTWIYREAKKIDEIGPNMPGTSVRAGMRVLQANGLIESYFWATTTQQVIDYLLRYGPVVVGTPWFRGMDSPDKEGRVRARGKVDYWHAWLIVGANVRTGLLHAVNSYGASYGVFGHFSLAAEDFDTLLNRGATAAAALEPNTRL